MPVNIVTEAIKRGMHLVVVSPHLDDAVLSCGALMIHAAKQIPVIVATLFTEAGPPPYTFSARRNLRQVGAQDPISLYGERRAEDRAALESIGVTCVHAGLTEALYRRRAGTSSRQWLVGLLPELGHVYPLYRSHIISGRIASTDSGTLQEACVFIEQVACPGRALVLAPLGVGGHVDHLLARTAAGNSGAWIGYYSDFPYNQRHRPDESFIRRHGLIEAQWSRLIETKADIIRAYRTQAHALFNGGNIPIVPEIFFLPEERVSSLEGRN